jgi:hypothetical protein
MNDDLFHCYPLNNIPQFQENSSAQQRYSHSSFHELILNRGAIATSWAPLEQQDNKTIPPQEAQRWSIVLH